MTTRMLVVDDHPADRTLVARALRREFDDVHVVEAGTPSAFTDACESGPYTAVVTDFHLRWSTGLEVLSAVRSRWDVPVVMFTDTGNEEVAAAAFLAGVDDYIIKRADAYARLARGVRHALERRVASERLVESERRYRALADALPNTAVFVFDRSLCFQLAAGSELPSLGLEPRDVVDRTLDEVLAEADATVREQLIAGARAALDGVRERIEVLLRSRAYLVSTTPLRRLDGSVYAGMAMVVDVSHLRETEALARRLSQIVEQSPSIVVLTDEHGAIRYVNARFSEVTGYAPADALGQPLDAFPARHPTGVRGEEALWAATVQRGGTWRGDVEHVRKDGTSYVEAATISPLRDEGGRVTAFVKLAQDVTEQRALTRRVEYLAFHDDLTGLPNRALLLDRTTHAIHRAQRTGGSVALLFLDLDGFKVYNDSLGHNAGDMVLREVTARLTRAIRAEDTVARLGSDEFGILLAEVAGVDAARSVAATVVEAIGRPLTIEGHDLVTSVSMGIALFPEDAVDAGSLLTNADLAMSHAKASGRSHTSVFTQEVASGLSSRLTLELALRHAVRERQFRLVYQARVRLADGAVTSFEALVRWNHPELGSVSPGRFIPVAEETGLIHEVGREVLELATAQLAAWRAAGLDPLPVAINVSALELGRNQLAVDVAAALTRHRLSASLLELEVTETAVMSAGIDAITMLGRLRDVGVRLSVDDFGTAYSSLAQLVRLPVDCVKIDQAFVRELERDGDARRAQALVRAVIGIARSLDLATIAEGVETAAQRDFLASAGCGEAQGYLFMRPAEADAVLPMLTSRRLVQDPASTP